MDEDRKLFLDDRDADALYENVKDVANPRLDMAFERAGDSDERGRYERLARAIRAIAGEARWQNDRTRPAAIVDVFRRAIEHREFPEFMTGRSEEQPKADGGGNMWKGLPEREFAHAMYGFSDNEIAESKEFSALKVGYGGKFTYQSVYRPWVIKRTESLKETKLSNKTASRILKIIWQDITLAILDLVAEAERQRQPEPVDQTREFLVDRLDIRDKLTAAFNIWPGDIIWVEGPPGAGKTKAVEKLLKDSDESAVWINCINKEKMHDAIADFLDTQGASCPPRDSLLRKRILEVLSQPSDPSTVIFDNYETELFPELATHREYASRVIILSRYRPPAALPVQHVYVGDLLEFNELIVHYIPDTAEAECRELGERLYWRALLISQACKHISTYSEETIQSYLASIATANDRMEYIYDVEDAEGRTITAHYSVLIARLEQKKSWLPGFLDFVASFGYAVSEAAIIWLWSEMYPDGAEQAARVSGQPPPDVQSHAVSLGTNIMLTVPDGVPSFSFRRKILDGIESLAALGLMDADRKGVRIHPLTSEVLQIIRATEVSGYRRKTIQALSGRLRRWQWRPCEHLSSELILLVDGMFPMIFLEARSDSPYMDEFVDDLELAVAAGIQTFRQYGHTEDDNSFALKILAEDSRHLVRVEEDGRTFGPQVSGALDPNLLAASPETRYGCTALVNQLIMSHLYGTARSMGSDWTWRAVEAFAVTGIGVLSHARYGLKSIGLDIGLHRTLTRDEIAVCEDAFSRQNGGVPNDSLDTLREDQQLLLLYGRYLASLGELQKAIDVLLLNARTVTLIAGSTESIWVAVESLRVCCDTFLRAGRTVEACTTMSEMIQLRKHREVTPGDGPQRFFVIDRSLDTRMKILQIEMTLSALEDDALFSILHEAESQRSDGTRPTTPTKEEYREWIIGTLVPSAIKDTLKNAGERADREVQYETLDQRLRWHFIRILIGAVDTNDVDDNDDGITQRLIDRTWSVASARDERISLLTFIILVSQAVYLASDDKLGPSLFWLIDNDEHAQNAMRSHLGISRSDHRKVMRNLKRIASSLHLWTDLTIKIAEQRRGVEPHWYHMTRYDILIACLAQLGGAPNDRARLVRQGMDAARKYGREDWVALIGIVRAKPLKILQLLII